MIDDLQWCDAPSARALAFIARRLEGQPLALILATRPLDPALTPEAATLAGDPGAELLRPSPLTEAAVGALVAARLSERARRSVRPRVHRGDGRQPIPRRRAAGRGGGSRPRAHRGRGGRGRRDRPARRRERRAAPPGAAAAGGRRARPCVQRARRRRAAWATLDAWPDSPRPNWRRRWRRSSPPGSWNPGARSASPIPILRTAIYGDLSPAERERLHQRRSNDPARARGACRPGRGARHAHRAGRRPRGRGTAARRRPRRAGSGRRSRRGRATRPRPRRASR